jgi:hypothetical protein
MVLWFLFVGQIDPSPQQVSAIVLFSGTFIWGKRSMIAFFRHVYLG